MMLCFWAPALNYCFPYTLYCMSLCELHKQISQTLFHSSVYRSIRKWWVALPANHQQLMREWSWQRRWHLAAWAGVAMVIVSLLLLTHLDESPVTGRTRLLVFSRESYMELAAVTSEMVREGRGGSRQYICVWVCVCYRTTWSFLHTLLTRFIEMKTVMTSKVEFNRWMKDEKV